jgi:TPR repeat protein
MKLSSSRIRWSRVSAALTVAALLVACQFSTPVPDTSAAIESVGILALQAHDAKATAQLTDWAQQGSPVAQRELALALTDRAETVAQAMLWFEKAATAGDAPAQFTLAQALYDGKLGLTKDHAKAWTWFEKAAQQGNGKASFMLARMASHGFGVPKSAQRSAQWLQKASEQQNPQAMYQLSVAYQQGDGVPHDSEKADYWLEMAAELDDPIAVQALALQLEGQGGPHSAAHEKSRHLMKEASDHRRMNWNAHQ